MHAATLQTLRETDDPIHWEIPPGFPWKVEIQRIRDLMPRLEEAVGHSLELDESIQDAAHFAEVYWRTEPRRVQGIGERVLLTFLAIRFSSFGRLVALWGNVPEAPLSAETVQRVHAVLSEAGYTPVANEDLDETYTGINQFAAQIRTWWDRFFDYC